MTIAITMSFKLANFYIMYCLMSGCLSIGRNLWKNSAAWLRPIIQSINVTYILGVAIGPQIARPFVGHDTYNTSTTHANVAASVPVQDEGISPVQFVYFIVAGLDFGMALICMITGALAGIGSGRCNGVLDLFFRNADDDGEDIQLIPGDTDASTHGTGQPQSADVQREPLVEPCSRLGCVLLTLVFLLLFLNAGRDDLMTGLLYTYLYEYLGWPAYHATLLLTSYESVRFVVGLVLVPVSYWVSPNRLMLFDLTVIFLSSVLMLVALFVPVGSVIFTVAGVVIAAFEGANVLSTLLMLVEETIPVTAPLMALFVAALGLSYAVLVPVSGISLHASTVSYPAMLLVLTAFEVMFYLGYSAILHSVQSSEQHS